MENFALYIAAEFLQPLPIKDLMKMLQIDPFYTHFIKDNKTLWFWKQYCEYHNSEYLPEEGNLKRALQLRALHRWCPKKYEYREFIGLTKLDLSCCNIKIIPDSLSQLTNLQKLYLRFNKISEIPDSLSQLTNLLALDLRSNEISEIQPSLRHLPIEI